MAGHAFRRFVPLALVAVAACGAGASTTIPPEVPLGLHADASPGDAAVTGTMHVAAATDPLTVTVAGTAVSTTVVPGGTFAFDGVPAGPLDLLITGRDVHAHARLSVEPDEAVDIVVGVAGSSAAVLVADRRPRPTVEIEGRIDAVDPRGPAVTVNAHELRLAEWTSVRRGEHRVASAELAVGQRVRVRAARDEATGHLRALEISLQPA